MKIKAAKILSVILGEHVWLPLLLIVILLKSGLMQSRFYILFPILLILLVIVPIVFTYISFRLGKVSALDLPKREERNLFFIVYLLSYSLSVIIIYLFGNKFLLNLSIIIFVLLLTLATITHFWKISLHASMNTSGSIIINFLFNWSLPWLYLLIPIVFWARYILRRHTISQLLAGTIVTGAVILGSFYYLGYIKF